MNTYSMTRRDPALAVGREADLLRPLGGQERMLHHYSVAHPRHFCIVAELSVADWEHDYRAAFETIHKRHPMFSAYVRNSEDGPCFYRSDAPLKIDFIPSSVEPDWQRVVERELATAFPADEAPLMRVKVLYASAPVGASHITIVLTVHHAIADAMSAVYVIQDLMEILDGRILPPLPVLPPVETIAARKLAGADALNPDPASKRDPEALRTVADAPLWRPFEGDRPLVSNTSFDKEFTARIVNHARANGTTLHGALCAAVACSVSTSNQELFSITSAINVRDMLGLPERNCALLVSIGTVRLALRPERDFWRLARQATSDLAHGRTPQGVLSTLGAMEANIPPEADVKLASGFMGSLQYDAVVSNLGALTLPTTVGSVHLKAIWGPLVQGRFTNERVIGAASVGGELRIVQTTPRHIPSFLGDLSRVLADACAGA